MNTPCLYCRHPRRQHRPDTSHSSHKADLHSVPNYTPAHCQNPVCTCVMFCETAMQAAYCRLPVVERWRDVEAEAARLGVNLDAIRPRNLVQMEAASA